jgi:hypothetical protein
VLEGLVGALLEGKPEAARNLSDRLREALARALAGRKEPELAGLVEH